MSLFVIFITAPYKCITSSINSDWLLDYVVVCDWLVGYVVSFHWSADCMKGFDWLADYVVCCDWLVGCGMGGVV